MTTVRPFHVLLATDGSTSAKAALSTARRFPWVPGATASVVVARQVRADYRMSILLSALDRTAEHTATSAAHSLARRWPDIEARVVEAAPVDGILQEAVRTSAEAGASFTTPTASCRCCAATPAGWAIRTTRPPCGR